MPISQYILFLQFLQFGWEDFLDILLVAVLFFQLYKIVKGTAAINIFIGIIGIMFLYLIVDIAQMKMVSKALGQIIEFGGVVLIIVFQQEVRKFLIVLGTRGVLKRWIRIFRIPFLFGKIGVSRSLDYEPILEAVYSMSSTRTGALIVISRKSNLSFIEETGDVIDAQISARLLEDLFFKNSPMHDGAVTIRDNRIKAARCVLPVTENDSFPSHLGMRHRAAVGITENSDCISIVVSEQTGGVSIADDGKIFSAVTKERLEEILKNNFTEVKN